MPLQLSIQPSQRLVGLFLFIHLGALLCLTLSATPLGLKIVGIMVCLYNAGYTVQKYARLSHPKAIVQCIALENNEWLLIDRQGQEQTVSLLGSTWRSSYLLILNFKSVQYHRRTSVILAGDMLEKTILRRLQVYLTLISQTL